MKRINSEEASLKKSSRKKNRNRRRSKKNKYLIQSLKFRLGFASGLSLILAVGLIVVGFLYVDTAGKIKEGPVSKVNNDDWIRGEKDAPITIMEYSDTECPFCKDIHQDLKDIVEENDEVNWVYRHFPIKDQHDKAFREAIALECAGDLKGNDDFWNYLDKIYEITPSNNELEDEKLFEIAADLDFDEKDFRKCVDDNRSKDKINAQIKEATLHGAINAIPNVRRVGTPHIYILYEDQEIPVVPSKNSIAGLINLLISLD